MKSLAEKVFDRLNERNPDLLAEIIDEIESEENSKHDPLKESSYQNS
ncbi:MAG: hypothetical protein ABFC18_03410 [Rikenellaceae bacterium]